MLATFYRASILGLLTLYRLLGVRLAVAQACDVPVVINNDEGLTVAIERIENMAVQVFEPTVITLPMPLTAGISGDLIQADKKGILIIRCKELVPCSSHRLLQEAR